MNIFSSSRLTAPVFVRSSRLFHFSQRSVTFGALLVLAAFVSSCGNFWSGLGTSLQGSGISKTEKRDVAAFTRIVNTIPIDIEATTKQDQQLELTGDDNVLPYVKTTVSGGTLFVDTTEPLLNWSNKTTLRLKISMRTLESVEVSGVGSVTAEPLETPTMRVAMSGAGNITLNKVKVQEFSASVSGVGQVRVQGEADRGELDLSGAGNIQARSLVLKQANVRVSGVGSAYVSVLQTLDAAVSGAGNVIYYGSPATVNRSISGVGSIRRGE